MSIVLLGVVSLGYFMTGGESVSGVGAKDENIVSRAYGAMKAAHSSFKLKSGALNIDREIKVPIRGDVRVEIIDAKTLCFVGCYTDFLRSRFTAEYGDIVEGVDFADFPKSTRNVCYNCMGAEIILKYRPKIVSAYADASGFQIDGGAEIAEASHWFSPQGQSTFPSSKGTEVRTRNADTVHYAFLKLSAPLEDSKTYTLKNPLGESVKFTYSAKDNISPAIKVNQVGYAPSASRKYAYVGAWLGTGGALDLSAFIDAPFSLIDESKSSPVFSGRLVRRPPEREQNGERFSGEDVLEADFSAFSGEGKFHLYIDGIGRSLSFAISNASVGESFYIHAKGLYHKRCGTPKTRPFTNWTMGACHTATYRSDFPPNNNTYWTSKKHPDCGFFDASGKGIDVNPFRFIGSRMTDDRTDICGGWHDAADYDRRPYHYDVVNDLLSVYLFRPRNFCDSQLNIPESGNYIPDIVDEAVWGMEIWRKAQNSDGSVGGWIEATSHPRDFNPSTDTQRYYLSAATRESTMQYAAHASMLSLALRTAGMFAESRKYLDSALLAYKWASNPQNRFIKTYSYALKNKKPDASSARKPAPKLSEKVVEKVMEKVSGKPLYPDEEYVPRVPVTYRELPKLPPEFVFKAAFNLWILTGEKNYLDDCVSVHDDMPQTFAQTTWRLNPLLFSEFLKFGAKVPKLQKIYKSFEKTMLEAANERLLNLDNAHQYRIPWPSWSGKYVENMAWGKYHPLVNAKFFVNACEITGDKKYRDAAYLAYDWHNGTNPLGRTMTSGLGQVYPMRFLDLASYTDNIDEYVQGITPYSNIYAVPYDALQLVYALNYAPNGYVDFAPRPVKLFPKAEEVDGYSAMALKKELMCAWPVWHRFANLEEFTPNVSEFTISETIAPACAVTGWLLEEPWKPLEELKNRKPVADVKKLRGYAPLP